MLRLTVGKLTSDESNMKLNGIEGGENSTMTDKDGTNVIKATYISEMCIKVQE